MVLYKFLDPKWEGYPKTFLKSEGCKVITSVYQVPEHRGFIQELGLLQKIPEFQVKVLVRFSTAKGENRKKD